MVVGLLMGNGVLNTLAPFDIKCIWYSKPFIQILLWLASWLSNSISVVIDSSYVNARSCSFWPSYTFSCSFSTKFFWSSKSRLDFFKLTIIVDTMAFYFFKAMGLEEIIVSHTDTTMCGSLNF
jgi:hypothetical protein